MSEYKKLSTADRSPIWKPQKKTLQVSILPTTMPGVQTDVAKVHLMDDVDEVYSDPSGSQKILITRVSRRNAMWRHAFVLGGLLLLLFFLLASAFLIAGIFTSGKQVEEKPPMDEVLEAPTSDAQTNGGDGSFVIEAEFDEYEYDDYVDEYDDYDDEYDDYDYDYEQKWRDWVEKYGIGNVDEYGDDNSYDLWNFDEDYETSYEEYDDKEWDYYNDWYDGKFVDDVDDYDDDDDYVDNDDDEYYYADWEEEYQDWLNGDQYDDDDDDDDDDDYVDTDADDNDDERVDKTWETQYYADWLKDKDYENYDNHRSGVW